MAGIHGNFRKLAIACKNAFDFILEIPDCGELEDVNFQFGPPAHGKLPFFIIRNGHRTHLCNLCDYYPPFDKLCGWMDRATTLSADGTFCTEVVTLDTDEGSVFILLAQSDWTVIRSVDGGKHKRPVSVLLILQSGTECPLVLCFCRTDIAVGNLYHAMTAALNKYKPLFDKYDNWFLYERKWLDLRKTSDYLLDQINSKKLEIFTNYCD